MSDQAVSDAIDRLETLLAKGTPAPWIAEHNDIDEATIGSLVSAEFHGEGCLAVLGADGEDDAELIVALHTLAPRLIAAARSLEATTRCLGVMSERFGTDFDVRILHEASAALAALREQQNR